MCEGCKRKRADERTVKRAAKIEAGLCPCGAPADGQTKQCVRCRDRERSNLASYRQRKIEEGICSQCLRRPAKQGGRVCVECLEYELDRTRQIREEMLLGYGSRCACCEEAEEAFLELDHVEGGHWEPGNRPPSEGGSTLWKKAIELEFPDCYQLLCGNCNWSKRLHGSCQLGHGGREPIVYVLASASSERAKQAAYDAYGRSCACCSLDEFDALSLDHVEGGGSEHRRQLGGGGSAIYTWLRDNDFPAGFQTLCRNCNKAKHTRGECPHQTKAVIADPLVARTVDAATRLTSKELAA